jgi:rhodanese-related sulfurtransferase
MNAPYELSPTQVKQILDAGGPMYWVDVRERSEFALASIAGAELVPMREVPGELAALRAKADQMPLVVFCHHGVRSLNVVNWLREQGVDNCLSMAGGIDAWSRMIDSSVPQY